jgi:hypothetical protein
VPLRVAKMKFAFARSLSWKSDVLLKTWPVGDPPGIVTTSGAPGGGGKGVPLPE